MGSTRNRTGKRPSKFNQPGGMHRLTNTKKYNYSEINQKLVKQPFVIKKHNPGVKMVLSKLIVKRAMKYRSIKDTRSNKIYLKKTSEQVQGSRIVNVEKLKCHIAEVTAHAALCEKARQCALNNDTVIKLASENSQGFYSVLNMKCQGCGQVFVLENSEKCANSESMDINLRSVWGSMVTGGSSSIIIVERVFRYHGHTRN